MKNGITWEETTILKAIAILTVILAHANGGQAFERVPILQDSTFVAELCQGGMCTFLILSGYGLYCSYINKGFDNWWDHRLSMIYYPAMMIQVLFFVISLFITRNSYTINWESVIGDLLCINQKNGIDGSMWYLSYALFCYIMFYCCFYYFPPKLALPFFGIIWIILLPIAKVCWVNGFYCVSSFLIGVVLGKNHHLLWVYLTKKIRVAGIILSTFVSVYYYNNFRNNWLVDNAASNIMALGFLLLFSMIDCRRLRLLGFIGKNSFILYLLQGKTISKFPYTIFDAGVKRVVSFVVVLIISIVFSAYINNVLSFLGKRLETVGKD